eukprot:5946612-Prymnesium_polylepis.1
MRGHVGPRGCGVHGIKAWPYGVTWERRSQRSPQEHVDVWGHMGVRLGIAPHVPRSRAAAPCYGIHGGRQHGIRSPYYGIHRP